ncbi:MAG: glycosidase [Prolixibacteraceae bacterium]
MNEFELKRNRLQNEYESLIAKPNIKKDAYNGIYTRYQNPILTDRHVPVNWKYDLNQETNPMLLQRIGANGVYNSGAIKFNGKYVLAARIEGWDRKSYFAIAESENGIDNFRFWEKPIKLPENNHPDINVYDMRLIKHEDGFIYGIFCSERKDKNAPEGDTRMATADAGLVRTKDLINWERLPDLISTTGQQRNAVLHPEFVMVNGVQKYAMYTRPQDGFIEVGGGGGIGLGYIDDMSYPEVKDEVVLHAKTYHTIYELKNGLGPAPIKTNKGWLQLAHGVRYCAAGMRYVLYVFMTDLEDITKVTHLPSGHFMAPQDEERVGDVSNVLFVNGWICDEDGKIFIYYASSDTRMHVATTSVEQLIDYCMNTPEDGLRTGKSVDAILDLIENNAHFTI